MASIDALRIGRLAIDHAEPALALSVEAGWNQTVDDWRVMLVHGTVLGARSSDGRLVGSAAWLPFGEQLVWIAMVLVAADWRRRGLGRKLSAQCTRQAERDGRTALLDATDAGRRIYVPLGFEAVGAVTRYRADRVSAPGHHGVATRQTRPAQLVAMKLSARTRSIGGRPAKVVSTVERPESPPRPARQKA